MKSTSRWSIEALLVSGLLAACSSGPSGGPVPVDGSTMPDTMSTGDAPTTDAPATDAPATDAPATDAPRTDAPRTDATGDRPPAADPCASVRDISATAPAADGAIHIMGDSSMAPGVSLGMLPMGCVTNGAKGNVVVFQYTMHTSALLRVSTDNATTSFDSVVAVLSTCSRTATALACNDDSGGGTQSTAVTSAMVAAGTHVFVVVGGFGMDAASADSGAFELTVREVTPRLSGQSCTDTDVCATGTHCLASPTAPTMRVCVADGTMGGACLTGRTCNTGLACSNTGVCRPPLAVGATCMPTDACAAGAHCVAVNADGSLRRCLMDGASGAACRITGTACDAGLTCSAMMPTATAPGVCRAMVAVGAACDTAHSCPTGSHCLPGVTDPAMTTCQTDGARGSLCRMTATPCDTGLTCSAMDATMDVGLCRSSVMGTAACDLDGRSSFCGGTSECAPNATFTVGACAAPGTAAGVSCRTAAPFCDTGLTCSVAMPSATDSGVCHRAVAAGAACDYQYGATACMGTAVCAPSSVAAGSCATPRAEMEPNNTPMAPQAAVSASTVFQAAIMPGTDVDCFAVTVPANASLYLETGDGHDGCPAMADTILTLYTAAGVELATNDDGGAGLCSIIDGVRAGPAHHLAAGNYVVCANAYAGAAGPTAIMQYFVTVGIVP